MFDYQFIKNHLISKIPGEKKLLLGIESLHQAFTKREEKLNSYMEDPFLVSCYALFYHFRYQFKWSWVRSILSSYLSEFDRVVDFGCGTGTFSFCLKSDFPNLDVVGVEKGRAMRRQFELFSTASKMNLSIVDSFTKIKADRKGFLFLGHSLNEMNVKDQHFVNWMKGFGGVAILAPGAKEFFPNILKLRESLIDEGFSPVYPCPHSSHCEMKEGENWCHQNYDFAQDSDLQRLESRTGLETPSTGIFHFYLKKETSLIEGTNRVVNIDKRHKGRLNFSLCTSSGLEELSIMKRNFPKSDWKKLGKLKRGEDFPEK